MSFKGSKDKTTEVVTAIASASQTPFKTAFKVSLGMFAAQLTGLFVIGLTLVVIGAIYKLFFG